LGVLIIIYSLSKIALNIYLKVSSSKLVLDISELSKIYSNNKEVFSYVILIFIGVYVIYKSLKGIKYFKK
jgi:ABC-type nickel/cobalt efflux system permease component RcnA